MKIVLNQLALPEKGNSSVRDSFLTDFLSKKTIFYLLNTRQGTENTVLNKFALPEKGNLSVRDSFLTDFSRKKVTKNTV